MTREQKIALILGFALVLVVGVLVSDHLSGAREATLVEIEYPARESQPIVRTPNTPALADNHPPNSESASRLAYLEDRAAPEPEPRSTFAMAPPESAEQSALDLMQSRVAEAMQQLANGHGPKPAMQTDTITMGEPLRGEHTQREAQSHRESPEVRTHIVRRGETLWQIAERYYGTGHVHEQLREYNRARIRAARQLNPGLTLLIPPRDELGTTPAIDSHSDHARPKSRVSPRTYTVRKGDTLSEISLAQLGTSKRWEEILELNTDRLDEATDIRIGMVLNLPAR